MMSVRPIGHHIHVQPDTQPTMTEGGLYIPDAYADDIPPMSGIVVAVGKGAYRDARLRQAVIAHCLAILDDAEIQGANRAEACQLAREEMLRYMQQAGDTGHLVAIGQRVIFPMDRGHEIVLNEDTDGRLVILNEDDVIAVYDTADVAA